MSIRDLVDRFGAVGGRFLTPADDLRRKLDQCRAIVFDWDGVFNDGQKAPGAASGYSEADSMGTNMLRYGLWLRDGELPYTAIITGENNDGATELAEREHLAAIYSGIRRKQDVITHLCAENGLQPDQVACVFDDINDLAMAESCGLRLVVRRDASPLFSDFVEREKLCDYLSGTHGGDNAVREICELLLGLMNCYADVVRSRVVFDEAYANYFRTRQSVNTLAFMQEKAGITAV